MGWKHKTYIINSDPGHMRSKQQLEKTLKVAFASLFRKSEEKGKTKTKKKLEWQLQSFLHFTKTQKSNNCKNQITAPKTYKNNHSFTFPSYRNLYD